MNIRGPLRYLIGADESAVKGQLGCVTVLPYDAQKRSRMGTIVQYGNLLDEEYTDRVFGVIRRYGPYAKDQSGTPADWHEGRIDAKGPGWRRYLSDQFARVKANGITTMELDNADSYHMDDVLDALNKAQAAGIFILAKNPLMVEGDSTPYVAHQQTVGVIVEAGCGTCDGMQALRIRAKKPNLPIWFVSNKGERNWALNRVRAIKDSSYKEMGVTWCPNSADYSASQDLLTPVVAS